MSANKYNIGDTIVFRDAGCVVVHWVSDTKIGFAIWKNGYLDPLLVQMTPEDFEASLRLTEEGREYVRQ